MGVVAGGLIMAFAVIPFASPPRLGMVLPYELLLLKPLLSYLPGLFFFLIPVALCIPTMTVLTVIFVRYVQQVDRRT